MVTLMVNCFYILLDGKVFQKCLGPPIVVHGDEAVLGAIVAHPGDRYSQATQLGS